MPDLPYLCLGESAGLGWIIGFGTGGRDGSLRLAGGTTGCDGFGSGMISILSSFRW